MAYATVTQLEARWRTLTATEKTRAGKLLEDAAVIIDGECPPASPLADAAAREMVSCSMVKRAMASGEGASVDSQTAQAGPFANTFKFSNPSGDLYLTKQERRTLGCRKGKPFMIDTMPPGAGVQPWMGSML